MNILESRKVIFGCLLVVVIWLTLGIHLTASTANNGGIVAQTDLHSEDITIASGSILYVNRDAAGAQNGTCWADAYTDLQDALAVAVYGDEIWVAEGVYRPSVFLQNATFQLKSGVGIYGGFCGSETGRDQRDWETHVTVLCGDIGGNDITNTDGVVTDPDDIRGGNSFHVLTSSQVTGTAVLDGFTVTAGNAWDPNEYDGGGMYNDSSSPTIVNVTFIGNLARRGGGMYNGDHSCPVLTNVTFNGNDAYDDGGGMYNTGSSDPTLIGVILSGNEASDDGGGMYNANNSAPSLTDVTFNSNKASDDGGGMYNWNGSNPILTGVTFSSNSVGSFGGGLTNNGSSPTLTDVFFIGNKATSGGGGGMVNTDSSHPMLTRVTFNGNQAWWGGGLYNFSNSDPKLIDVTFIENTAHNDGGGIWNGGGCDSKLTNVFFRGNQATTADGGGMYNQEDAVLTNVIFAGNYAGADGGGLFNWQADDPALINVSFGGNRAGGSGGGMYTLGSEPSLTNVTFSGNHAGSSGGGMYSFSSDSSLANCILWSNGDSGGTDSSAQIHDGYDSDTDVDYSLVQGGHSGTGNLNGDPQFVIPITHTAAPTTTGNLRLLPTSPAIDAGNNTAVHPDVTTDLDGNLRFADIPDVPDTGNGVPPIVDMGAYEVQADLFIAKSVLPSVNVLPGETITYVVSFGNSGTYTATGVVITDHLPIILTSAHIISSGVSITDTGASPAHVWQVQDLSPGNGGVITLTSVISPGMTMDTCFTNTATIMPDTDTADNTSSVPVAVTLPQVAFSSAAYQVAENSNSVSITVAINPAPLVTVIVDYATADGSATVGDDYIAASGTLTFTQGAANQTFTVSITDDDLDEGDETVALTLSNPRYANLGDVSLAVLTVIDDDGVELIYLPLVIRNHP
ncbi:MAG: DUF11 domain-containing protein [Anaerolineales bacterium]|nr:DUF11 domain-containing protein [Anaerolineales bacterium]